MKKIVSFISVIIACIALQSCSPVSVATGVGASASLVALEDRSFKHSLADINLKSKIIRDITFENGANFFHVHVDVFEGRVLLTGIVPYEHIRKDVVSKVNAFKDAREVINEIKIGTPPNVEQLARDEILKVKIVTRLTFDQAIRSINYIIRVVDNEAFIIGLSGSNNERQLILSHIKSVQGLTALIDFVTFKDDPDRIKWLAKQNL